MSETDPKNVSHGEPENGPLSRDAYFMSQRLMGPGQIENLAGHRRRQLALHRQNQAYYRDQAPAKEDVAAVDIPAADDSTSGSRSSIVGELNWTPLGPAVSLNGQAGTKPPVSGRIEAIAVSDNGQRVYLGSANGGIWRSDDGGNHWAPTMNAFNLQPNALQADSLSVGGLGISPANPDIVYVGTGEGGVAAAKPGSSASGAGYFGVGPAVSTDGGLTWMNEMLKPAPADSGAAFYPLAVDPGDPGRVVAPTSNGIYVREPRNEFAFAGKNFKPQSYLFRYTPATGEVFTGYWSSGIDDLNKAVNFGADSGLKDFDTLTPFVLQGQPYFIYYNRTNGKFLLYYFLGDGVPKKVTSGTWATGLTLMAFQLNGLPHLAQYDPTTGKAKVIQWNEDGSSTVVQNELTWRKNWSLLPLVVLGIPYFIGYNATDGSASLLQWLADATTLDIWRQANGVWATGATLAGFELQSNPYFIRYVPADGSYVVSRVQDDLAIVDVLEVKSDSEDKLPTNMALTSLTFNDEPYLLGYVAASGATTLYKWSNLAAPEKKWNKTWDKNLLLMPFLMGFQWIQKKAPGKNETDIATSVVVANDGVTSTFFAAFKAGPVFKSVDRGATWTQVGDQPGFTGRISLAVQPSSADLLYAFDADGKVRRLDTTDQTNTWSVIGGTPSETDLLRGQGFYDLIIAVLPTQADTIFLGGATYHANGEWSGAIFRGKVKDNAGTLSIDGGTMTFIGNSVHADIHALAFNPAVAKGLWVGCDGGAFYAPDVMGVDVDNLFESRNAGVNTMTLERMGQHPTYDAVLFVGSQDNGCQRYLGDPAWTVVKKGDSGTVVVNRTNTKKVICSYVKNVLVLSAVSGNPDTFTANKSVPSATAGRMSSSKVLFYAPLVGTPSTSGQPNYLAFGADRPYLSKDFGDSWASLPKGDNTDKLPSLVRSLSFSATSTILYVGTLGGQVYRLKKGLLSWSITQIDKTGQNGGLPAAAPVTGIAVVPGDNDSIYISYGGQLGDNGWKRVWYYNGSSKTWTAKSGTGSGNPDSLLDIQYNTIRFGASANELFVGGDLGVWQSSDGGGTWKPMANGLPESAVLDLAYFPKNDAIKQPALLRASTYGRGVYEWILSSDPTYKKLVQLYIRSTILDRGLYPVVDNLTSPVDPTEKVSHRNGPDIKVIQENSTGAFDHPAQVTFLTYSDKILDRSQMLTKVKKSRIYVQVHQRGVQDAENTSVRIVISTKISDSKATAQPTPTNPDPAPTPPTLPDDLVNLLRTGTPLVPPRNNQAGWYDLGTMNIPNLITGVPRVVSIDVAAQKLPTKGTYCVMAIAYQKLDPFTSTQTNADKLTVADSKVAMKYIYAE